MQINEDELRYLEYAAVRKRAEDGDALAIEYLRATEQPSGHSILPPSSAARRVQCRGSRLMESLYPELEESDAAREGTASHELAAMMVESASRARDNWPHDAVGQMASNGVEWDQASYDGAEMYADAVREVMTSTGVFTPQIEQRVDIGCINEQSWGTPDTWLLDVRGLTLYGWDYKYGHRPVEVYENWQMIEYMAGIVDMLRKKGMDDQTLNVVITIVQPRAPHRDGPIRSWSFVASDLRGYVNKLIDVEAESLEDDAPCTTGPECRDCKARRACPTLIGSGGAVMEFVGQSIPVNLDANALATTMVMVDKAYELVKALKSGLDAQAEGMLQSGVSVPGFALEQGWGRQKWSVATDELLSMCDLLGIDVRKKAEPITPKQALKLGVDESVIKEYSITPRTSAKLVSDSRNKAKEVFSKC